MQKLFFRILGLVLLGLVVILFWPRPDYVPYKVGAEYKTDAEAYYLTNLKPLPQGWRWDMFEAKDGAKLRWGVASPENPKATIVFVPGYTGALEFYGETFALLMARGYRIVGFDLRGQGGSARAFEDDPERMWTKKFRTYSDDLAGFVKTLSYEEPLILTGESFGGHAALRAVVDHDLKAGAVDGLFLQVPMFKVNTGEVPFNVAEVLVTTSIMLGRSKNYLFGFDRWEPYTQDVTQENSCGSHPARLHTKDVVFALNPELRVGSPTNQWFAGAAKSARVITAPSYLKNVTVPTFMITASDDTIVDAPLSEQVCREDIPNCQLVTIPDTRHCINFERDEVLTKMFDYMDGFVNEIAAEAPLIATHSQ